ncbi:hypothetical protein [Halosimplex halobium]|uniref:hypothetical protein n=1 Tax=Halosimplex halobium TaxID=3396618 RepID=UPI003F5490E3
MPGGTVYPKPRYGVGDDWTLQAPGTFEKPWRKMCSATWPHVGPGFTPAAIDAGKCSNIKEATGQVKASLADYVPGATGSRTFRWSTTAATTSSSSTRPGRTTARKTT